MIWNVTLHLASVGEATVRGFLRFECCYLYVIVIQERNRISGSCGNNLRVNGGEENSPVWWYFAKFV